MKWTIAVLVALACGCGRAPEADKPPASSLPPAEALFEKHTREGTLLCSETAREFRANGWGRDYARLVKRRWKGRADAGIELELRGLPNHEYRVGQRFDCVAVLTNRGEPRRLNTGGNCGMTHALGLVVIPPDGGLGRGWCRGKVGGPHCFCQPAYEELGRGRSVNLATGFASDAAVSWEIAQPGEYLVVGSYALGSGDGERSAVYSSPLVITVD